VVLSKITGDGGDLFLRSWKKGWLQGEFCGYIIVLWSLWSGGLTLGLRDFLLCTLDFAGWKRMERVGGLPDSVSSPGVGGSGT